MDYTLEIDEENKVLRVTIPLLEEPRISKKGRSRLLATTGGHIKTKVKHLGCNVMFGLNVFIPLEKKPEEPTET